MSNQTYTPKTDFEHIMEFGYQLKAAGVSEKNCGMVTQYCALSLTRRDEEEGQGAEILRLDVLTKKLDRDLVNRADAFLREIIPLRSRLPILNDKFSDIVREPIGIFDLIEQLPPELLHKGWRKADLAYAAGSLLERCNLPAAAAAMYTRTVN